jgi:hypothetical protein
MFRVVATILVLCGLVACSEKAVKIDVAEVNGAGTVGLSASGQPAKGLIVYFHGADQDAGVIQRSSRHRAFFDPLLRAGYAVVAATASGNAFGNPESREAYRQLIRAAQAKYTPERLFFVAESMGMLPALALLSEDSARKVKGMVGISPLMGIPSSYRSVTFVANVWGGHVPDGADPLSWPQDAFAGRALRLYSASEDDVVPPGATARDFAKRFGAVATIEIVDCAGAHVADDCYQGDDVREWMSRIA